MYYPEKEPYLSKLRGYSGQNVFSLSAAKILPPEEAEKLIKSIFSRNSGGRAENAHLEEYENKHKSIVTDDLLRRTEEARKKGIGIKISSLIVSDGGNDSMIGDGKQEIENRGASTAYVVIECNGIVLCEPLGQPSNGTFIGERTDELEKNLSRLGRQGVLLNDVMFKVIHNRRKRVGDIPELQNRGLNPDRVLYDYDSNHLVTLLEAMISHPQELLAALSEVKKEKMFSNLSTLLANMPSTTPDIQSKVAQLIQARGLNGQSVIDAGNAVVDNAKAKAKTEPNDEEPGLED